MNSNLHATVPVNVAVSEDVLKKIREHVLCGYPGEVCGILLGNIEVITAGTVDISQIAECRNMNSRIMFSAGNMLGMRSLPSSVSHI